MLILQLFVDAHAAPRCRIANTKYRYPVVLGASRPGFWRISLCGPVDFGLVRYQRDLKSENMFFIAIERVTSRPENRRRHRSGCRVRRALVDQSRPASPGRSPHGHVSSLSHGSTLSNVGWLSTSCKLQARLMCPPLRCPSNPVIQLLARIAPLAEGSLGTSF